MTHMTKHAPATPLPWGLMQGSGLKQSGITNMIGNSDPLFHAETYGAGTKEQDAAYIAHACNAYPRLVAALQRLSVFAEERCKELDIGTQYGAQVQAAALLTELGEDA